MIVNHTSELYIKKHWVLENPDKTLLKGANHMIPDGCLEVMFVERGEVIISNSRDIERCALGIYVAYQVSDFVNIALKPLTKVHFVKLFPWVNGIISSTSFKKIANKVVPLSQINQTLFLRLSNYNLAEEIEVTVRKLCLFITENVKLYNDFDLIYQSCTKFSSKESDFKKSKKEILSTFKISSKTLENKFKHTIGLSPKQFEIVVRLRAVAEKLKYEKDDCSLTSIAQEFNFFDQAHFIRTFKSFFKLPPGDIDLDKYFISDSKEPFRYYTI
ncbi:helix-turn-helix domain-containing protein [Aquimarina sediminis]|uniref:helix-turn-helix domain-containing protein n=1 Tax=Aquimarina sediminis TaxID=2070536 RepID=UPI000CA07D36|nr:helix-turn-helix domain-containing protein [Aquimarina sediminis]